MNSQLEKKSDNELIAQIGSRDIFRRAYKKRDGRQLFLYGYQPHKLDPLPEDNDSLPKGGELRWHPLRNEWNVYAAHRQNRTFKPSAAEDPLAPSKPDGAKTEIPFEDFEMAVFDNKFTNFHIDAQSPPKTTGTISETAKGRCDVIVYGPEPEGDLQAIGQEARELLVKVWSDRYKTLFGEGHEYILPFENRGDAVGVTLHHPHGQIYAFPFVPNTQQKMLESFQAGYDLPRELNSLEDFVVAKSGRLTAFCPPFARFPYEVWITPNDFSPGPWAFSDDDTQAYARLLGEVTRKYDAFFKGPTPYMMSLHAAPRLHMDIFHFTTQFYPLLRAPGRVKYLASVEQATGVFTVDVMPKTAAETLRAL